MIGPSVASRGTWMYSFVPSWETEVGVATAYLFPNWTCMPGQKFVPSIRSDMPPWRNCGGVPLAGMSAIVGRRIFTGIVRVKLAAPLVPRTVTVPESGAFGGGEIVIVASTLYGGCGGRMIVAGLIDAL